MGARSDIHVVDQPFPVVFEALTKALPGAGFDIERVEAGRGWIELSRRNRRVVLAVGAVDAIATEWVATSERTVALGRARHDRVFRAIERALDAYLRAYYPSAAASAPLAPPVSN